jgi:sugar phosphate isomerase/epimerase
MIMYGTGDPMEAIGVLHQDVVTVHCKDGRWPPKNVAGALGHEEPLGQGDVDVARFIAKLKQVGYKGTLNVEREGAAPGEWGNDVRAAVEYLRSLT